MKEYDLIVIGSGPAGEKAAVKAAYHGHSVAVIEREVKFGGAGSQTGTLPSKTLKETAIFLSGFRSRGVFGVERKLEHEAGIQDFYYRKNYVSEVTSQEIYHNLFTRNVKVFKGTASFIDKHRVKVEGAEPTEIYGKNIIIATGSYPVHFPGIPFDKKHVHDSDSILEMEQIPESLVIVGAGVIGCEYATIFAVMGCKVTIINSSHDFLSFIDHEVRCHLEQYMEDHGIRFIMGNKVDKIRVEKDGEKEEVYAELSNGKEIHAEMFLYAAGRSGNIKDLKLENTSIETGDRETIVVNENYQTNEPHIYAVGDVIGFPALASTSMDQGRVAVAKIFNLKDHEKIDQQFPYGIYTIPEVSCVGVNERTCRERGIHYGIGRAYVENMARARIMGYKDGLLKLIYEVETEKIIGVHIINTLATELIHFGMVCVEDGITLERLIHMVYNFPTMHELYKYAAYDALNNKLR